MVDPASLLGDPPWQLSRESWEEPLQLLLQPPMLVRWFGAGQPYGALLKRTLKTADQRRWLEQQFQQALGTALPQRVRHTLLQARRKG